MRGPSMKTLQERLAGVQTGIDKLEAQKALLLDMIREARGEPKVKPRAPRANVKQAVLDLLTQVAEDGLNAAIAVELADAKGLRLDRGSVSSILSRLKNEQVVVYEGERYRLPQFSAPGANIHPLRTSGAPV